MSRGKFFAALVLAAAVMCSLDLFYIVNEDEQAVVTQFGQPVCEARSPGLHVKIPFIQKAVFFDRRVMGWKSGRMEIATADAMPMALEVTARWKIEHPLVFCSALGSYEKAYARLDESIPPAVKAQAIKAGAADLVRTPAPLKTVDQASAAPSTLPGAEGAVTVGRDRLVQAVRSDASRSLKVLGIELVDVKITRIGYQERFMGSVYERMISERKSRAAAVQSAGEGRKAEIAGLMEKDLLTVRSEAFKIAEEIRGKADAEAIRIYGNAYGQDPDFYSFMKTLETYKSTSFENTTLILGTDADFYKLLKGPSK
jgi:modulator of FtsH protease HflC